MSEDALSLKPCGQQCLEDRLSDSSDLIGTSRSSKLIHAMLLIHAFGPSVFDWFKVEHIDSFSFSTQTVKSSIAHQWLSSRTCLKLHHVQVHANANSPPL